MKSSKVQIEIEIFGKNQGFIKRFKKAYSMQEHFDEKWRKDGEVFAVEKLGLDLKEIVVHAFPIVPTKLDVSIKNEFHNPALCYGKVHNPMHSSFSAYRRMQLNGVAVLIKSVSSGIVYSVVNAAWEKEYNELTAQL